jgi:hypothetical protein
MTYFEIPLSARAQRFTMDINGTSFTLHIRWNQYMNAWIMNIHDFADNPLPQHGLNGIPLLTGTDLMGQFRYLGIGGGIPMIVLTIGPGLPADQVPTTNLGIDGHLFFETL